MRSATMVDSAVAQVRHLGTSRRRGVPPAQKVCIGAHPSRECADTGRSGPFVSLPSLHSSVSATEKQERWKAGLVFTDFVLLWIRPHPWPHLVMTRLQSQLTSTKRFDTLWAAPPSCKAHVGRKCGKVGMEKSMSIRGSDRQV